MAALTCSMGAMGRSLARASTVSPDLPWPLLRHADTFTMDAQQWGTAEQALRRGLKLLQAQSRDSSVEGMEGRLGSVLGPTCAAFATARQEMHTRGRFWAPAMRQARTVVIACTALVTKLCDLADT